VLLDDEDDEEEEVDFEPEDDEESDVDVLVEDLLSEPPLLAAGLLLVDEPRLSVR
jgi:hypothetical protein